MNKALHLALAALLGLAVCSAERVSLFLSCKLEVVQGNGLDPRVVVSLQPDVTHDQVILLLGTPLLRGPFHADRWGYTFSTSRNDAIKEQVDLILCFENGLLACAEGNAVQEVVEAVQAEQKSAPSGQAAAPLK